VTRTAATSMRHLRSYEADMHYKRTVVSIITIHSVLAILPLVLHLTLRHLGAGHARAGIQPDSGHGSILSCSDQPRVVLEVCICA
jgi:hypothetical protein